MSRELSQLLDQMGVSEALRVRFQTLYERQQRSPAVQGDERSSSTGQLLGRYRDLGQIGRGGMAVVQRVQDSELNRQLAMKIIDPKLLGQDSALTRFVNEAQTLSQLQHPNIVPVHELGQLEDGRYYFTMKEVKGLPLSEIIRRVHEASSNHRWESSEEGWNLRRLMDVYTRICAAVAFAHSRGVIHRDLKPENILIGDYDQVLVVDWGIAKIMGQGERPIEASVQVTDARAYQTQMGSIAGTPAYMAPEQARGQVDQIDERTDVYALGAILYEMLSGRCPYNGTSHQQVLSRVLGGPPPSVRQSVMHTVRVTQTIEFDFFSDLDDLEEDGSVDSLEDGPLPLPDELVLACEKAMHRVQDRRFLNVDSLRQVVQDWIDGTRKRDKALKVVEEALGSDDERQQLESEAVGLRRQATEQSSDLPRWASEEALAASWDLEDRAASFEDDATLLLARREQLLQAALTHKADLPEAHENLVQHYLNLHRGAEAAGQVEEAARAALRIGAHLEALAPEHPVRKEATGYLQGEGSLSLQTDPVGAQVYLAPYETQHRRLVPGSERFLGTTPLQRVPIEMGSYQLRIVSEGCHDVIYPIHVTRQHHWDGADPEGQPVPIWLPPLGTIGENECFVAPGMFVCGRDPGVPLKLPTGRIWVDGFTMRRYPVTNREIIAWLDDLSARGLDEDLENAIPRPRSAQGDLGASCFERQSDGTFTLVADEYGVTPELDFPVVMMSWVQMNAYARWFSEQTGQAWRLPAELEWEKAARGVDGRTFPWGEGFASAWCCMDESKESKSIEVVDSRPDDCSPYGVMDMAGHVFEWTRTEYSPEPTLPEDGRCHIHPLSDDPSQAFTFKGGSWHSILIFSRCAMRIGFPGITQWPMAGFRLVRSLNEDG